MTEILAILDDTSDSNAVRDTALAVSELLDAGVAFTVPGSDPLALAARPRRLPKCSGLSWPAEPVTAFRQTSRRVP